MADIATSIAIPTEPWVAAKNRFLAELTEEEQKLFENATLENLFYSASAGFKQHENDSKTALARRRLKPLLENLEGYEKALDVFSQISATILCPLWGSLKIVLHLAREHEKYYAKLLDMYERVGDCIPTFRTYEALFPTHEALLASIADAYLMIVKFSFEASKIFLTIPKSGTWKHSKSMKKRWTPFKDKFNQYLDDFRKQAKKVREQANLANMIEGKKVQDLVLANQALQKRNAELDEYHKVKALISDYDYMGKHRRIRESRLEGTGKWFLQHPKFKSWIEEDKSGTLCCFGIPGSGKTMLASAVIDKALTDPENLPSVTCFHYCDYAEVDSLDLGKIIGNIARQLLDRLDILRDIAARAKPCLATGFPLYTEELQFYLNEGLKRHKTTLIVIDGIDELTIEWQRALIDALGKLGHSSDYRTKVLLFCRGGERLNWKTSKDIPFIEITLDENGADLHAFIERDVRGKLNDGDLVLNDPFLETEIVEKLAEGAHDMFLWAKFQIQELCYAPNDEAMRNALSNLPKTLVQTYDRIVCRIANATLGEQRLQLARKVFMWIICARRPLTLEELQEATAIEKGDRFLKRDKVINGKHILDACSNLVAFSTEDRSIRLAHRTVQRYLVHDLPTIHDDLDTDLPHPLARILIFSQQEAQHRICAACLTYIKFSDFQTQVVKATGPDISATSDHFSPSVWRRQLQPFAKGSKIVPAVARILQRSASHTNSDFSANLRRRALQPDLKESYALLDYISKNWPWHINSMSEYAQELPSYAQGPPSWVFSGLVPRVFRPWICECKSEEHPPYLGLLKWAIKNDLQYFVERIPDFDSRDVAIELNEQLLFFPLLQALYARSSSVALFLVQRQIPHKGFLEDNSAPISVILRLASTMPDPMILGELLKRGWIEQPEFKQLYINHCKEANTNGIKNIVRCLLSMELSPTEWFMPRQWVEDRDEGLSTYEKMTQWNPTNQLKQTRGESMRAYELGELEVGLLLIALESNNAVAVITVSDIYWSFLHNVKSPFLLPSLLYELEEAALMGIRMQREDMLFAVHPSNAPDRKLFFHQVIKAAAARLDPAEYSMLYSALGDEMCEEAILVWEEVHGDHTIGSDDGHLNLEIFSPVPSDVSFDDFFRNRPPTPPPSKGFVSTGLMFFKDRFRFARRTDVDAYGRLRLPPPIVIESETNTASDELGRLENVL